MDESLWNFGVKAFYRKRLTPICKIIKIDAKSEEVSKGLFIRVCMKIDITKPLEMELNLFEMDYSIPNKFYTIDYENIINVSYWRRSQKHKFDEYYMCVL